MHARLMNAAWAGAMFGVDLQAQAISLDGNFAGAFAIEPWRRAALMSGADEIALALEADEAAICAFEAQQKARRPWLYEA